MKLPVIHTIAVLTLFANFTSGKDIGVSNSTIEKAIGKFRQRANDVASEPELEGGRYDNDRRISKEFENSCDKLSSICSIHFKRGEPRLFERFKIDGSNSIAISGIFEFPVANVSVVVLYEKRDSGFHFKKFVRKEFGVPIRDLSRNLINLNKETINESPNDNFNIINRLIDLRRDALNLFGKHKEISLKYNSGPGYYKTLFSEFGKNAEYLVESGYNDTSRVGLYRNRLFDFSKTFEYRVFDELSKIHLSDLEPHESFELFSIDRTYHVPPEDLKVSTVLQKFVATGPERDRGAEGDEYFDNNQFVLYSKDAKVILEP